MRSLNLRKRESVTAQQDQLDRKDHKASQVQMDLKDQPDLPGRMDFPVSTG